MAMSSPTSSPDGQLSVDPAFISSSLSGELKGRGLGSGGNTDDHVYNLVLGVAVEVSRTNPPSSPRDAIEDINEFGDTSPTPTGANGDTPMDEETLPPREAEELPLPPDQATKPASPTQPDMAKGEAGVQDPSPSGAPDEAFEPFSEDVPEGAIGRADAPRGNDNIHTPIGNRQTPTPSGQTTDQPTANRSSLVQGVNKQRFAPQIKDIDNQIPALAKNSDALRKEIKKLHDKIRPLERKQKLLSNSLFLLKAGRYFAILFGVLAFLTIILFKIGIALSAWAANLKIQEGRIHMLVDAIHKKIAPIREEIAKKETERKKIVQEVQALARRRHEFMNRSLLSRSAPKKK